MSSMRAARIALRASRVKEVVNLCQAFKADTVATPPTIPKARAGTNAPLRVATAKAAKAAIAVAVFMHSLSLTLSTLSSFFIAHV